MDGLQSLRGYRFLVFTRMVTIAGLHEFSRSLSKITKFLWLVIFVGIGALAANDIFSFLAKLLGKPAIRLAPKLQFTENSLALSNLTACLPITYEISKLQRNLFVGEEAGRRIAKRNTTADDVIALLAQYEAFHTVTPPPVPYDLKQIFALLLEDNSDLFTNLTLLMNEYFPSCDQLMINCTLAKQPYNCCEDTELALTNSAVCYKFTLNKEDQNSFRQSTPGPDGGFSVDIITDLANSFYIDGVASDGLLVFTENAVGPMSIPTVVWPFSHMYLRIEARKRARIVDCYDVPPKLKYGNIYDANGLYCAMESLNEMFYLMGKCHFPLPPALPNSSTVCSPLTGTAFFTTVSGGIIGDFYNSSGINSINPLTRLLSVLADSVGAKSQHDLEKYFGNPPHCKPLCRGWDYETVISYAQLSSENSSFDDDRFTRNRITLYYGDFDYRIMQEELQTTTEVIIAQIGSILGVYAGISSVTLVQILIYGGAYAATVVYSLLRKLPLLGRLVKRFKPR